MIRKAVCLLTSRPDGKVLGIQRKNKPFGFGLPGGKLEPNETFYQALCREAYEEAGVTVVAGHQVYERRVRTILEPRVNHPHHYGRPPEWSPWDQPDNPLDHFAPCSRVLSCTGPCGLIPGHIGDCVCDGLIEDWIVPTFHGLITGNLKSSEEGDIGWISMYELINGPFGKYNLELFVSMGCDIDYNKVHLSDNAM